MEIWITGCQNFKVYILFFKRVLKSSKNLPRNGKTITKSFFSAVKSKSTRYPLEHEQDVHSKKHFDLGFENSQTSQVILLYFNDIYYCYSYCINITIVS